MTYSKQLVDVLVAGGGPAGAMVALCLARRGLSVELVEATNYGETRYGETLPPEINPVLRTLGVAEAFRRLSPLTAPGIISVWGDGFPVETDFIRNVHGCGWHVDRRAFDRMLVQEAERCGVKVALGHRVDVHRRRNDMWLTSEGCSRVLVDATGKSGLRIDSGAERDRDDELIAIALTIDVSNPADPGKLWTSIEATPNGWWYSAPLPQGGVIAMFFTDPAVYREEGIIIGQQLEHAFLTRDRLATGRIRESRVLRVSSSRRHTTFGEGWLAVGDSAFALDPIAGRGVFNALRWAEPAAEAIVTWLDGDVQTLSNLAGRMRDQYDEYIEQRRMFYASEQRWKEHRFWRGRNSKVLLRQDAAVH